MPNSAILLKNEYTAPSGHMNRQNGRNMNTDHTINTRARKDDEGYMIVRLRKFRIHITYYFTVVCKNHKDGILIPWLFFGFVDKIPDAPVGIFHYLRFWIFCFGVEPTWNNKWRMVAHCK